MASIPIGFEACTVEGGYLNKDMISDGKKLVLIAAPDEFEVEMLKGTVLVDNGVAPVNIHNDKEQRWEVNANSASDKQKTSVVFLDKDSEHCFGPSISLNLNVVEHLNIPYEKPPKRSKRHTSLPLPEYLKVRWKPFGSESPTLSSNSQKIVDELKKQKKKKKKSIPFLGFNIDTPNNKPHKKNKVIKENKSETPNDSKVEKSKKKNRVEETESLRKDVTSTKKKKKKKVDETTEEQTSSKIKSSKLDNVNRENIVEKYKTKTPVTEPIKEENTAKKKRKRKRKNSSSQGLEADNETAKSKSHKKRKHNEDIDIQNSTEQTNLSPKKKKKKAH